MKSAWTICNTITAVVVAWTLVSASLVSVGCSAAGLLPKASTNICAGIETRYLIVTIADGTLDLVLTFVPTYLCRHLQMGVLFKLQVLGVFALRLPVLPLAGMFYTNWTTSMRSNNPGVDRTSSLVYQQCHLCCSLVAATIPCLKSFIRSFDTGSGQVAARKLALVTYRTRKPTETFPAYITVPCRWIAAGILKWTAYTTRHVADRDSDMRPVVS